MGIRQLVYLILLTGVASKKLVFHTKLVCDLEFVGRQPWCAMVYFWELDSSSPDDPLLLFKFCTYNKAVDVTIDAGDMQGDGGMWGWWQDYFEISHVVYHTCIEENESKEEAWCDCYPSEGYTLFDYSKFKYEDYNTVNVYTTFYAPFHSYDHLSEKCRLPECFRQLDRTYLKPPNQGCSFTGKWNISSMEYDKLDVWFPLRLTSDDLVPFLHRYNIA